MEPAQNHAVATPQSHEWQQRRDDGRTSIAGPGNSGPRNPTLLSSAYVGTYVGVVVGLARSFWTDLESYRYLVNF